MAAAVDAAPELTVLEPNAEPPSVAAAQAAGPISELASSCNLCPHTYVWLEGLILERDNQAYGRAFVLDQNTDERLLTTGDIDFSSAAAWRGGFGWRDACGGGWEVGYLGVSDFSASDRVELADSLTLPGDLGLQVNNFFGADEVGVRYNSELSSFELNHVCCACNCSSLGAHSLEWFTGFRYFDLDERFGIDAFDSAEGATLYRVETRNHLYGGQVGGRTRVCHGCWSWETCGKVGLFYNDVSQHQAAIIDFPNFEYRSARGSSGSDTAFVADVNLTAIYQLNCVWGVRAGYNLIWIENVALAPDQIDFTNGPASGTRLVEGGELLIHGLSLGLEARY